MIDERFLIPQRMSLAIKKHPHLYPNEAKNLLDRIAAAKLFHFPEQTGINNCRETILSFNNGVEQLPYKHVIFSFGKIILLASQYEPDDRALKYYVKEKVDVRSTVISSFTNEIKDSRLTVSRIFIVCTPNPEDPEDISFFSQMIGVKDIPEDIQKDIKTAGVNAVRLVFLLLHFLNSTKSISTSKNVSKETNRNRVARGLKRLPELNIIQINPKPTPSPPTSPVPVPGTDKRPHDRRGHLRTYKKSGLQIWVKDMKIHPERGPSVPTSYEVTS